MLRNLFCFIGLFVFSLTALAEENLYEKNYRPQNEYNLKSLHANPETKMYVSNHYDEDNISMLEDGYDMMGSSGFTAGSIDPDLALTHAKSIKADVVLVYSKPGSKRSGLSKLELIREAANTSGEVDAELLNDDAEQFRYYASYWAKLPMPSLGLHVIKLKQKNKETDEVNVIEGLKVIAVINHSPAAKAGLERGDVLLKIQGVATNTPAELSQVVGKHRGQKVSMLFKRGESTITAETVLNGSQ